MSRPRRRRMGLVLWSAFLVGALWFLHAVGRGDLAAPPVLQPSELSGWLERVGLDNGVIAVVRLIALALAWYLVVITIVGSLSRASGTARLQQATDAVTLPFVRNLLGSAGTLTAAGLTLAVSPLLAPGSGPLDSAPAVAADGGALGDPARLDHAVVAVGTEGEPAVLESVEPAVLQPFDPESALEQLEIASLIPLGQATTGQGTWNVESGDHLWHIAEETLEGAWGRSVTDTEVAPYWREVIEANRTNLVAPDNPDLIYPGQVMVLPPTPVAPAASG